MSIYTAALYRPALVLLAALAMSTPAGRNASAQTPDQRQAWEAERAQLLAAEKIRSELASKQRETRKADPMAWVRTLDPMASGGWEFRGVAVDGSWAVFSTSHQLKRSGKLVTVWLRQEYAEPQVGNGSFMSVVQKVQYDCSKEQSRPLYVVFYSDNNLQGSERSQEADPKETTWSAVIPGTRDEYDFIWACAAAK